MKFGKKAKKLTYRIGNPGRSWRCCAAITAPWLKTKCSTSMAWIQRTTPSRIWISAEKKNGAW